MVLVEGNDQVVVKWYGMFHRLAAGTSSLGLSGDVSSINWGWLFGDEEELLSFVQLFRSASAETHDKYREAHEVRALVIAFVRRAQGSGLQASKERLIGCHVPSYLPSAFLRGSES